MDDNDGIEMMMVMTEMVLDWCEFFFCQHLLIALTY